MCRIQHDTPATGVHFAEMKVRLGRSGAIVAVAAALVLVSVVPAGLAAASAPQLTPGPTYTVWAYGVLKTVDFSGTGPGGYPFQGSATYGYSVVLRQTNLTTTDFELFVNRTMGATLSVEFCYPTCKSPSVTATLYHHAWEAVDEWANFTTAGTVLVDGNPVSAIALNDSHTVLAGSLLDTAQGPLRSAYLSANVSANADVSFTTPLGLLPENLTAPMNWTSSAGFVASGAYALNLYYHYVGPHATETIGPATLTGAVNRSGNVSVAGSTSTGPNGTVGFGGVPYLNVSLHVQGPFAVREGFILVPEQVDLFGNSSSGPVGSNESSGTSVEMTSLYVQPRSSAHLGIGGSEWLYAASAADASVTSISSVGATPQVSSGANPIGSTPVQGVPVPVNQADGYQGCLITGASCPSVSSPKGFPLGATLGIIAAVVVGSIVGVLIAERRRMPPPAYPNAELYPPGPKAPAPPTVDPSRSGAVRRPPPSPEDDPLANLW